MDAHALELLEFGAIRNHVGALTLGSAGARAVEEAPFLTDRTRLDEVLETVADWREVLAGEDGGPSEPFPDITPLFAVIEKEGTVLEVEEMAAVSRFVHAASSFARSTRELDGERPLSARLSELPDLSGLRREIGGYVSDEGEIRDDAVPELRRLARRIRDTEARIDKRAASYLRDPAHAQYWTSDAPTQRDGRTVLPLSANYRNRVGGIVHEVSQSGATLFVEPPDLVELNNELREAKAAYDQEIRRILRELTSAVRGRLGELRFLEAEIGELDALLARARYGARNDCYPAAAATEGIELSGARHPLLRGAVVPIQVSIRPPQRGLIITGPNTGGKTVALKTLGLLALMNQFGLEIPADEGSTLPMFDGVFADIGDEQSLEQSLSTFSGHMTNISAILQRADAGSLVLLDELGAGTDPEEGSALAMSILDELERLGCTACVTTHHGALKHYAYRSQVFENASVEFDPRKLAPTYHLLTGVPGTSHAIEIAARNGLPRRIVETAEEYVREGQGDEARIIEDLTEKQVELHRTAQARSRELEDLKRERADLAEQSRRLAERELALRKEGLKEFERLSRDTRSRLENLVREIREGELTREKTRRVREFLDELSETVVEKQQEVDSAEEEQAEARAEPSEVDFEPGMEVDVGESRRRGTVRRRGKGDAWVVEVGNLRMEVSASELHPVHSRQPGTDVRYERSRGGSPSLEIDLRGYRLPDALAAVDRQIDDCLLSGIDRFSIIHGKGEGVLQKGVQDHLSQRDEVQSHEFASPEEGGAGKTVVHLRES